MRLIKARLKGYAGIYRGSRGLDEILIDFTRCRHHIILIEGPNGSGKSTILNALQPMPDTNNVLMRGVRAEKELWYDYNGIIYKILIIHDIRSDGITRAITKAYLTEIIDGAQTELNPNGNISSYKEILYDKFGLDPNFVALSHLSVDDKGIVNKTPSERKRFVSDISDAVELYNDIYKKLSKKALSYNSLLSSITAKINNIGNRSALEANLEAIKNRIDQLSIRKETLSIDLARYEASIHLIDPDKQIQNTYLSLRKQLSDLNSELNRINISLVKYKDLCIDSLHQANTMYNDNSALIIKLESEIAASQASIETMIQLRDADLVSIQNKTGKLDNLTSEYNYKDLEKKIRELRESLKQCVEVFHKIGLDENTIMTKDEFVLSINIVKEIMDMIDLIKSYSYDKDINDAIHALLYSENIPFEIESLRTDLDHTKDRLNKLDRDIMYYEGLSKSISILDNRPNNCKIDSCPFIKEALDNQDLLSKSNLDGLIHERDNTKDYIKTVSAQIEQLTRVLDLINKITIVLNTIALNRNILSKLPGCDIIVDRHQFLNNFTSNSFYTILQSIYEYGVYSNIFEVYKNNKELLSKYESEYSVYTQKSAIIDEINHDLDELNHKVDIMINKIQTENKSLQDKKILLESIKAQTDTIAIIIQLYKDKSSVSNSITQTESDLNRLSSNMDEINDYLEKIEAVQAELNKINPQINMDTNSIHSIGYSLKQLDEYEKEYNEYKEKYSTIELIKKYTSPKEGIQTLFVQLYMSKTLNMANELLALFFNGAMELLPYVINENEFRIPCHNLNSNIINDDINSCSSSEKSIISMLISFALLQQSSTKYNILRLDEIDGVLDQVNRSSYLIALDMIMEKLNVETCFVISHSSEFDSSSVDVIYLEGQADSVSGNIIFTY